MSRFALAVYCDDIRQELGNKISIIGAYREQMYVSTLPTLIPKVCAAIWVRTPIDDPFKSMKLKVYANEVLLVMQDVPVESETPEVRSVPSLPGETSTHFMVTHFALQMTPLQIKEPTILRVRIETEREVLRAGALNIDLQPQPQPA